MLTIYNSNRLESLAEALSTTLYDDAQSPIQARTIVTINQAMSSWLQLQLCQHNGIAANIDYIRPATFIWQLARTLLDKVPKEEPLSRENATWLVYQSLPALLNLPSFTPLKDYLQEDKGNLKRWQLSQRIADIFDRYQHYRPQMIRDWETDTDRDWSTDWQAQLWRVISEGKRHRVSIVDEMINTLSTSGTLNGLPLKIDLFSINNLPPIFVEFLSQLAAHVDIRLWVISPTNHYWGDLQPDKTILQQRLQNPEEANLWDTGNSLLASWGKQGQALQDLFLTQQDTARQPLDEHDLSTEPVRNTLLHHLQADIFELVGDARNTDVTQTRISLSDATTLSISVAHSPLRECQILHDRLLDMLAKNPSMRPEDMLVMIPDISTYAPYIEAVFTKDNDIRPFIPWNISDTSIADEHPLIRSFLSLLSLAGSRFSRSEVLNFLNIPEVCDHFNLSMSDTDLIRGWLDELHTYWGLDGSHKKKLGLPDIDDNTWEQARQRLFTGYALGDGELYNGIAPFGGVQGSDAVVLGNFWHLLESLRSLSITLTKDRLPEEWKDELNDAITRIFGEFGDDSGKIQRIRDAIADFSKETRPVNKSISPDIVQTWFLKTLNSDSANNRYYSGGVTCSGMKPMRSVPFQLICLLGMDDKAFPRREKPADFDLIQEAWKHGDPRSGDEDRYLFLETLLAAREHLYISYTGRDIKTNDEIPASVLVRELIDYVERHYQLEEIDKDTNISDIIITEYPLQAFSALNYSKSNENAALRKIPTSYDQWWCGIANAVACHNINQDEQTAWPAFQLEDLTADARTLSITELIRFIKDPVKTFVSKRLKLWLEDDNEEEDTEPFSLNALERYNIKSRLLDQQLNNQEINPSLFHAEGLLPHGALGQASFIEQEEEIHLFYQQLKEYETTNFDEQQLDLSLTDSEGKNWEITGKLSNIIKDEGLLRYRPAKLKGKDILSLWIEHLALVASSNTPASTTSHHIAIDKHYILETDFSSTQAIAHLLKLLELYWQGLHRPLPIFDWASNAWAVSYLSQMKKSDDVEKAEKVALSKARYAWDGVGYKKSEMHDEDKPYNQLMLRGMQGLPIETAEFRELSLALYQAPLSYGKDW